jgi:hypothetical protein
MGQIATVRQQEDQPIGCWIYVFDRAKYAERLKKPPSENLKASHYVAKRLVSTSELSVHGLPEKILADIFAFASLNVKRGQSTVEGINFMISLLKTLISLKDEIGLDPSKHFIRILPVGDCKLPNFMKLPKLRELVEPFGFHE